MIIGIDALSIVGQPTGVGRVVANLLRELAQLDRHNDYRLYVDRAFAQAPHPPAPGRWVALGPTSSSLVWNNLRLLPELRRHPVDVAHFPFHTIPLLRTAKTAVTINDLTYEIHPEWFPWKGRTGMRLLSRYAARRADVVLTCSQSTRRDLMRLYRVPERKIHVIPYGVEGRFRPVDDPAALGAVRARYGIGAGPFVLHLGTIHSRRNVDRLIRAFHRVRAHVAGAQLVLAGKRDHLDFDLEGLLEELRLERDVIRTDYVAEDDLPALYAAATLFAFPSSYEGFGFPPLEAMACGTAVLAADNSSFPEVAGDAAILVDPLDVDAMAEAMRRILDDADLRRDLVARGLERAARFSWRETAAQTLAVYHELGAS